MSAAKAAEARRVRKYVLGCLGNLGPHLLAASKALDGPDPSAAVAHLLMARAALSETIFAAESIRQQGRARKT